MDVNRQAWTAQASLLVHAADRYVGLRSERSFVEKGEPIVLDAIATDLDGRAALGSPIRLVAERLEWEQVRGEWQEVAARPAGARAARPRPSRRACASRTKEGGVYRLAGAGGRRAGQRERDGAARLGGRRAGAPRRTSSRRR